MDQLFPHVCCTFSNCRPYQFNLDEVKGFEYRAKDAWRSVTKIAVREARLKEIKQEILNSQKLKVCTYTHVLNKKENVYLLRKIDEGTLLRLQTYRAVH